MALETLDRILERIDQVPLNAAEREELIALVRQLRAEMEAVGTGHGEQLRTVAGFAEVGTHEATKSSSDAGVVELAIRGMRESVRQFEDDHPALVNVVHEVAAVLSRLGF